MAIKNILKPVLLGIVLLLFLGCSNDDDGNQTSGDTKLIGNWELIEIQNTAIPRNVVAPTDEDPIVIFFFDVDFNGRTPNNEFNGNYSADGDELVIRNFGSTTDDDTNWANQFFFALSQGYNADLDEFRFNYIVTATNLSIQYGDDLFLYFERY